MELFVRPEILVGVARLKEDSLRALPFGLLKSGGVNEQGAARALDDARRPDQLLERHLVDRAAAGEEVERRVNVRARVRAEMEVGEVDDIASLDRPEPDELGRRVARVDGCLARDDGHGNVNPVARADRKSTRLNSSHLVISYAVFCLKKKKNNQKRNKHKEECGP